MAATRIATVESLDCDSLKGVSRESSLCRGRQQAYSHCGNGKTAYHTVHETHYDPLDIHFSVLSCLFVLKSYKAVLFL